MSTTSSATASARDQCPFNESNLQNWMCIFILMKRDGTPLDVTSVLEEDIIEICIRLGHTHLLGVLCYLVTELIALFWSADNMQCATHRAIKATVLCEDGITVRTSAPSEMHVRAYVIVVNREPSGTQPLPLEGEEEVHSPTGNPQPSGGTPQHLQTNLGDLVDEELCQLMEDLHQEVTLHELNAHPRSPPSRPWENPLGNRNPNQDDQEVTFLRGGGWALLDNPKPQDNHSNHKTCMARWRMGSTGTTSSTLTPVQPNADVGCLINTLTSGLHLGTPRIDTFSSKATLR